MKIEQYKVIELSFKSEKTYSKGFEIEFFVEFTCKNTTRKIRAFWDGNNNWKVRFSPEIIGSTTAKHGCMLSLVSAKAKQNTSSRNDEHEEKLDNNDNKYTFECIPYKGNNPLYTHGSLRLSHNQHYIEHNDGTPFFWLADTAWNGVIRSDEENWSKYLTERVNQKFTAIQYVSSHWRGNKLDLAGETSCDEKDPLTINPAFFQRIDKKVEMINEAGLIAAPVAIWTLVDDDLGNVLSEKGCIQLAKYIVARYDAYQVVWLLGGDGEYALRGFDKWINIGRAAFKYSHNRLVTMHPGGQTWPNEPFRNENWFTIAGYQSGHGDSDEHIKWLVENGVPNEWNHQPTIPVINLEPNYETAYGYHNQTEYTDYHVRRATYWSLLVCPTAGVTYGHDAIWNWNLKTGPSEGHGNWHNSAVPPWHTGLITQGLKSMKIMRDIFDTIDWTTLVPYQEILKEQPGKEKITSFVTASKNQQGTVVIYSPCIETLILNEPIKNIKILNPATGETIQTLKEPTQIIQLPNSNNDWLIIGNS